MLLAFGCGDGTRAPATDPEISMLDPSQAHYGKKYDQWAVAYMQWQLETALSVLWDVKGCTNGQQKDSPVVFLDQFLAAKTEPKPCAFGSEKAILFPLFSLDSPALYYTDSTMPPPETSARVLEDRVKGFMDSLFIEEASISVDGRALREPESGQVQPTHYQYTPYPGDSLLFGFYAIPDAAIPAHVDQAFVAGYWVLLAPLAPGMHELSISIRARLDGRPVRSNFTYHLMLD